MSVSAQLPIEPAPSSNHASTVQSQGGVAQVPARRCGSICVYETRPGQLLTRWLMDYAMSGAEASGAAVRPLRHIKPAAFSRGFTGL